MIKINKKDIIKKLEKETCIKFSDRSIDLLDSSLDSYINGSSIEEIKLEKSLKGRSLELVILAISFYDELVS